MNSAGHIAKSEFEQPNTEEQIVMEPVPDITEDLANQIEKLRLEVVQRHPDNTELNYGQLTDQFEKKVTTFFPDYENPKRVIVLPRVDATEAKLSPQDPQGKGSIRLIFEQCDTETSGSKYVVVYGHVFRASKLRGKNKTIFNDALNKPFKNLAEAKSFNREQDFILLSPQRGLIFAEVKAFSNVTHAAGFVEELQVAKKQCSDGMLCMKAFIHSHIKEYCPSLCTADLPTKLDALFSRFAGILVFPSLSKQVLDDVNAREQVERLPKNFQVLFKEDREVPEMFVRRIEETFINIQDQGFYSVVYKIALTCCFIMRESMTRMRFTPDQRTTTRTDHLDQMERIFLDYQQNLVRDSKKSILFVDGVAGSGKTLICYAKMLDTAERYPDHGILYLCKNKNLASYVDQELEKQKEYGVDETGMRTYDKIKVSSLLDWLQKNCSSKLPPRRGNNERTKINSYVQLIQRSLTLQASLREAYQHVFVDEYQDLTPLSRTFLQDLFMKSYYGTLCTGNRTFCVFYDDMQSIDFARDKVQQAEHVVVPSGVERMTLKAVYRSPMLTAQYFTNYCQYVRTNQSDKSFSMGHEFVGLPVDVRCLGSGIATMDQLLYETVQDIKREHGLDDRDITVLYRSKNSIKKLPPALKVNCQRLSLSDFKGLENKVIIFYDPPIINKSRKVDCRVSQHYTVASRATWMCIILVKHQRAKNQLNRMMVGGDYLVVGKDRFEQKTKKRHASGDANPSPSKMAKA